MSTGPFKNVTFKLFYYKSDITYMYKKNLALNKPHGLIFHPTQTTQTKPVNV